MLTGEIVFLSDRQLVKMNSINIFETNQRYKQNERKNFCIKTLQHNYYENDTTINNYDIRSIDE